MLKRYSRGDYAVLPSAPINLEHAFVWEEYDRVELNDDRYVDQTATGEYAVFHFTWKHTNNYAYMTPRWTGKTSRAPSLSAVYLQIFNHDTNLWETIASNSTASANVEFDLAFSVTSGNMSKYYSRVGSYYEATFRVYQLAV